MRDYDTLSVSASVVAFRAASKICGKSSSEYFKTFNIAKDDQNDPDAIALTLTKSAVSGTSAAGWFAGCESVVAAEVRGLSRDPYSAQM